MCIRDSVKTPLASLVGYLEAVESGLVVGEEREAYIRIAAEKAQRLKEFVISLFEWVKLDAREQVFHFELADLHELSRSIVADWVPVFENNGLEYEIAIPETVCMIRVDSADVYKRQPLRRDNAWPIIRAMPSSAAVSLNRRKLFSNGSQTVPKYNQFLHK